MSSSKNQITAFSDKIDQIKDNAINSIKAYLTPSIPRPSFSNPLADRAKAVSDQINDVKYQAEQMILNKEGQLAELKELQDIKIQEEMNAMLSQGLPEEEIAEKLKEINPELEVIVDKVEV